MQAPVILTDVSTEVDSFQPVSSTLKPEWDFSLGFMYSPEHREPMELKVTGKIPSWLCGVLYRTGPAIYDVWVQETGKETSITHMFDGLARHHRFEIKDGAVFYRSRDGADALEEQIKKSGRYPGVTFAQRPDPCERIWRKFFTLFEPAYNMSGDPRGFSAGVTPVLGHSWDGRKESRVTMLTDVNVAQVVDPETLEPQALFSYANLHPDLKGPLSASHSCRDGNDWYNYNLDIGVGVTYRVFRYDNTGRAEILASITDAPPAHIHSLFLTEHFVVLAVWQCDLALNGLAVLWHRNMFDALKPWDENRKTIFYVVSRWGGLVAKFTSPPFYAFHAINSYEDPVDGSIILDVSAYPDHSLLGNLFMDNVKNGFNPIKEVRWRRFRLAGVPREPPRDGELVMTFEAETVFVGDLDTRIELPSVAPHVQWKPYRFAYGTHLQPSHPSQDNGSLMNIKLTDSIIKIDTSVLTDHESTPSSEKSPHLVWRADHLVPGEPVLVLRPRSQEEQDGGTQYEDDGVLLVVALDAIRSSSSLFVLDAQSMLEIGRAEFPDTHHIPFDVHGAWDGRR
ncbi:hypothetical protein SISSUDRAFT_1020819 [Sistotremastrum suecicum HHB10207 ss-3]|uniref:Carotenoid oxygenase n=1 Tax=Sistotremastrum suecicum HHB10207 ss-3 TaxID=1314776 RepID=A0A166DXN5_9AGAM|nr:hypothetical protein SISSUDRAFT_1020819 [Sistotremastrum suecicum HHB10207 ss-3]